jgi:AraC family transcriptional regulator
MAQDRNNVKPIIAEQHGDPPGWRRVRPVSNGAEPMCDVVRASSQADGWSGLDARLIDTCGGPKVHPAMPRYCVGMLIGSPVIVTWRSSGQPRHRLQVPGDIHIVPLGHSATWEDDQPTQYLGISLMPSLMSLAAEELRVNLDCLSLPLQMQLRDEKMEHIALAIKAELEEQNRHDRVCGEGLGLALAAQLIRKYGQVRSNRLPRGLSPRQEENVKDFICQNLTKDFSLGELAAVASMSPSHFRVLFRQSVGLPVHKYVIKCRVDYAVELLSKTSMKLSDVALNAGFADQSHMSRCMRRVIGLTPAEVKRSVR